MSVLISKLTFWPERSLDHAVTWQYLAEIERCLLNLSAVDDGIKMLIGLKHSRVIPLWVRQQYTGHRPIGIVAG